MEGDLYSVAAYLLAVTSDSGTCDASGIAPLLLRAIKSSDNQDVILSYNADPNANGYNSWYVDLKTDIACARQFGCGLGVPECDPASSTTCVHGDGVPSSLVGPILYYQVRGACNGQEGPE
jgi:hypothetical protein